LNSNIRLFKVSLRNWDKNKLIFRIIRLGLLTIKLGIKLLNKAETGDKVVMVTNPAPLLLFVAQICKWKKLKLVIIVHDVFPENLKAANIIKGEGFLYKILLCLFNKSYNSANLLIVLGRDMKKMLASKTNLPNRSIKIIENWSDTHNIYPIDQFQDGTIKLQFAGNFGRVQGLLELIKAIHKADNPNITIEFLGNGTVLSKMKDYVHNHKLASVAILPSFSRSEQLMVLNKCDIGIVSLASGMAGLGVPSKTYNILAAGKPILFIGDMNSEIAILVKQNHIGWVFPDFGKELVSFLKELSLEFRKELISKGLKARQLAETKYAKSIIIDAYRTAINSI
jgi:glycosyltransferase involved in cell wall biosynthesis